MSEGRTPSPDFDRSRYERPNRNWVCGHACDGKPCRIGPSPSGHCRATTECHPELELRQGEEKGTWRCTRPPEWGGLCQPGPLPDGSCCRPISPCQPVRSLRARRGLVTRLTIAAAAAVLLIGLGGAWRESFVNPAPVSPQHRGTAFARLAAPKGRGAGCVACHPGVHDNLGSWAARAGRAAEGPLALDRLVSAQSRDFSAMDANCVQCHRAQSFHQPDVARDPSCTACHREHEPARRLMDVRAESCIDCHGDGPQMIAAARKGRDLPASAFPSREVPGIVAHASPRPPEGYTRLIHGFAADHPEFRVLREGQTDANPLRFNHRLHLTGDIPPVNGHALDCAYCHRPDIAGAYMQRVSFEDNCQACHALNFDENNPGLSIPHGDPAQARAYLRSLPTQYADFAMRERGLLRESDIQQFVTQQMRSLRSRMLTGENLERAVFFADSTTGEATTIAGVKGHARARFAGCAFCHEVTPHGDATPTIATPRIPDRWLLLGRFNHRSHASVDCRKCHAAEASTRTTDILIPSEARCVECHSPKGGVRHDCMTCHHYHNEPAVPAVAARAASQQ